MRKLFQHLRGSTVPQFAIRKEERVDGTVKLTPMVKLPGFMQTWTGITENFGKYLPVELHSDHEFTREECDRYIEGYKKQLKSENAKNIINISYEEVK